MTKILTNTSCCGANKGAAAMAISAFKSLKESIPDVDFVVLSGVLPDLERCAHNIKHINKRMHPLKSFYLLFRCALWSILHKYLGLSTNVLINEKILQAYVKADIVIDLRGDTLNDDYGILSTIFSCTDILFGIFLEKPVVIYPQSIGPFKTKLTKYLARFTLNRVNLIMVREEITRNYLQEKGINKPPIYLISDISFLLQPAPSKRIQEILLEENINRNNSSIIIGLSISQQISRISKTDYGAYVNSMTQIVDYLTDKLNATVVFVPHVIASRGDDRIVAEKIYQKVRDKNKVISITNEYTPEELRGIIGKCDLFIGARMHANISAISTCVPTVAIAYSHKTCGIMRMLGQEKYVCDIKTIISDNNEIISKINSAWNDREKIRKDLETKIKVVKERALLSAKLVKELLDSLNNPK